MNDVLMIGIRFALYADLMLLAGLAAFPLYALKRNERRNPAILAPLMRPHLWLAILGLAVSAYGMIVLTANMQGVALLSVDPAMLVSIVSESDAGKAWLVRMLALFVAAVAAWCSATRPAMAAAFLVIAGSIALTTLIWTGHAGATEGALGSLHRISDALHMIAAAIWLGAILAFLVLLRPRQGSVSPAHVILAKRSLDQFARIGTICVLVIAGTGLINAQIIVGVANLVELPASSYGQLLMAKFLFFGVMLVLAAANRWRRTPALQESSMADDQAEAAKAIRQSLTLEALAGLVVLALVAWLGTLAPTPVTEI